MQSPLTQNDKAQEKLSGIVKRITFHSVETGYTVLKVNSFAKPSEEKSKP
jgi:exodeoxyribonuclease V alpha subunit